MPKRDTSQEALRQVETITDSKPVRGETLLRSRKLKRQLAEARKRAIKERLTGEILNYYNQSEATPSHLETNSLFPTSRRFLSRNRTKF